MKQKIAFFGFTHVVNPEGDLQPVQPSVEFRCSRVERLKSKCNWHHSSSRRNVHIRRVCECHIETGKSTMQERSCRSACKHAQLQLPRRQFVVMYVFPLYRLQHSDDAFYSTLQLAPEGSRGRCRSRSFCNTGSSNCQTPYSCMTAHD